MEDKSVVDTNILFTNLINLKVSGEAGSADENTAIRYKITFEMIINDKGNVPEQVYNTDETGLFIIQLESKSYDILSIQIRSTVFLLCQHQCK